MTKVRALLQRSSRRAVAVQLICMVRAMSCSDAMGMRGAVCTTAWKSSGTSAIGSDERSCAMQRTPAASSSARIPASTKRARPQTSFVAASARASGRPRFPVGPVTRIFWPLGRALVTGARSRRSPPLVR